MLLQNFINVKKSSYIDKKSISKTTPKVGLKWAKKGAHKSIQKLIKNPTKKWAKKSIKKSIKKATQKSLKSRAQKPADFDPKRAPKRAFLFGPRFWRFCADITAKRAPNPKSLFFDPFLTQKGTQKSEIFFKI